MLLKHLAARQTRYVNTIERRTGTLWEGRYKSSPVETETYLLACSRYIELNPVRAGIVPSPGAYRWSSYRGKIGLWQDPGTDLDPCYEALGAPEQSRRNRYREFVGVGVLPSEQTLIREALQRGQLTGTQRFADEIERKLSIRVEHRGRGRPPKASKIKSVPFLRLTGSRGRSNACRSSPAALSPTHELIAPHWRESASRKACLPL